MSKKSVKELFAILVLCLIAVVATVDWAIEAWLGAVVLTLALPLDYKMFVKWGWL